MCVKTINNITMANRKYMFIVALAAFSVYGYIYVWNPKTGNLAPIDSLREKDMETRVSISRTIESSHLNNAVTMTTATGSSNSSHASDKIVAKQLEMETRLKQIQEQCQNISATSYWQKREPSGKVWQYKDINYCIVPKVGCTYWKRLMRYISGDFPPNRTDIHEPSDIDRYFVHYGPRSTIKEFVVSMNRTKVTNNVFMFTRDPYTRLWSGYLDKLFLPDFWRKKNRQLRLSKQNLTENQQKCGSDFSFEDFIKSIVNTWPHRLDEHWEPIHLLCSPCHLNFSVIGKIENFKEDASYVKTKFGIDVSEASVSRRDMVLNETMMLIKYNFDLKRLYSAKCFKEIDIAHRLWKTFQYNGYIDRYIPFPDNFTASNSPINATQELFDLVKSTIDHQTRDISSQKRNMLLEAYRELPHELLEKIKDIYKYDFELFGYEKDLFN